MKKNIFVIFNCNLFHINKVQSDGTFIKPKNEKLTYSGMLAIRAVLPASAARILAAAVTVATRYSCVRRQSELRPG